MLSYIKNAKVASLSVGAVISQLGQVVTLPLFIASFQQSDGVLRTGPFFVVWFCSLLFNFVFTPLAIIDWYKGRVDKETIAYAFSARGHLKLFLVGAFNAVNGVLVVYSSGMSRVPAALQPILLQSVMPMTLFLSKLILHKTYLKKQIMGAVVVILSILVFFIPTFIDIGSGKAQSQFASGWGWPVIMVLSCIPAALMNILEEAVFEDEPTFNAQVLLAVQAWYQSIMVTALFWTDILKNFGTSSSLSNWATNFHDGFLCFADSLHGVSRCEYTAALAAIFAGSYTFTYLFSTWLMRVTSANYAGILASLSNPLGVVFWLTFPALNRWGGGSSYDTMDIVFAALSIPLMLSGAVLFRVHEPDHLTKRAQAQAVKFVDSEPLLDYGTMEP